MSPDTLTPALDWWRDFRPFSAQHAATVVLFGGVMTGLIAIGRRARSRDALDAGARERRIGIWWGLAILAVQVGDSIFWLTPPRLSIEKSLPLALCDLAAWLSAMVLLCRWRWARTLLYFWGLCLSSQAFATPILREGEGLATGRYWLFWIVHTNIVGVALYDLVVRGFRPAWRDAGFATIASVAYVGAVLPLNIAVGANYGFLGSTDQQPGVVAVLGAWPWRVYGIIGAGVALFALAVLPWALIPVRGEKSGPGVPTGGGGRP